MQRHAIPGIDLDVINGFGGAFCATREGIISNEATKRATGESALNKYRDMNKFLRRLFSTLERLPVDDDAPVKVADRGGQFLAGVASIETLSPGLNMSRVQPAPACVTAFCVSITQ